jgi:hypothetical protein
MTAANLGDNCTAAANAAAAAECCIGGPLPARAAFLESCAPEFDCRYAAVGPATRNSEPIHPE